MLFRSVAGRLRAERIRLAQLHGGWTADNPWTQRAVARRLRITATGLGARELGRAAPNTLDDWQAWAAVLGLEFWQVVAECRRSAGRP